MICNNCGNEVPMGMTRCNTCGAVVAGNVQQYTQPMMQPYSQAGAQQNSQQYTQQNTQQYAQPSMQQYTQQNTQQYTQPNMQQYGWQNTQAYAQNMMSPMMQAGQIRQPSRWDNARPGFKNDKSWQNIVTMIAIGVLTLVLFLGSDIMANSSMIIATLMTCIPGITIIVLIYRLDKIEKEPVKLLLALFGAGAIPVVIVAVIGELFMSIPNGLFFSNYPVFYNLFKAFLEAALCEELAKYAALRLITWKHPAFNYVFDGVVYSTVVAIGFTISENIEYLFMTDASTAFLRASCPVHIVVAIYMGYFYGQAKNLAMKGDIQRSKKMTMWGLLIPITIHGLYDYFCFMEGVNAQLSFELYNEWNVLLGIIVAVLNVTAYYFIRKFQSQDKAVWS